MRLKFLTTAFALLGILLLLSYPWTVGAIPKGQGKEALADYALRLGIYIIAALLVWFATALFAVLTARSARQNFREEAMQNFQNLLEETMKDHGKKQQS